MWGMPSDPPRGFGIDPPQSLQILWDTLTRFKNQFNLKNITLQMNRNILNCDPCIMRYHIARFLPIPTYYT